MAQETVDPTCVATCRQEYRRCLMEKRTREGEVPPDVESRCREALQDCIAACGREPPEPKEEVIACNKIPGAPGRGMCMTMAADAPGATPANIAACKGLAAGQPCGGGDEEKEYLVCYAGKCKKMMLTPDKAAIWAESIKKCEGLAEGAACGEPGKTLACVGGVCKYVDASTPELIAACKGKNEGDSCGKAQGCKNDDDCPGGWKCLSKATNKPCGGTCEDGYCSEYIPLAKLKCVDGKCVECEEGEEADELCKNKKYGDSCGTEEKCSGGYRYSDKKVVNPDCKEGFYGKIFGEETWCCPTGDIPEIPEGEEFKWSDRIERLLALLSGKVPGLLDYKSTDVLGKLAPILEKIKGRMNYLFDYPRGTTEQERQRIINYPLEGMKRAERGEMQSMVDRLARRGMLGAGMEFEAGERIKRGTREGLADIEAQVAIDELDRRFRELMGTTEMATRLAEVPIGLEKWDAERMFREMMGTTGMGTDLIKTLMGSEVTPEQLSAGRRTESLAAMQMILNYLGQLSGAESGSSNVILQALLNQFFGGEQGAGFSDWMPWLLYYMGGQNIGG